MEIKVLFFILAILLFIPIVTSCDEKFIDYYNALPTKNQYIQSQSRVDTVNALNPQYGGWTYAYESTKCPAYSASSLNDWFELEQGGVLRNYTSYITGNVEKGTNPRLLEILYNKYANLGFIDGIYNGVVNIITKDPVTHEPVPYPVTGFFNVLSRDYSFSSISDFNIPSLKYVIDGSDFGLISSYIPITDTHVLNSTIIRSIDKNFPVLAVLYDTARHNLGVHHVIIVGYKRCGNTISYYIQDSDNVINPIIIDSSKVDYIFIPVAKSDWSTFHGNNRRTGLSLLPGDLNSSTNNKDISYNGKSATDFLDSPAFGNLDTDNNLEIVVGTTTIDGKHGRVFDVNPNGRPWSTTETLGLNDTVVAGTPEIADLDNDGKNEVIFGDRKGRLFVLDGATGQRLVQMPALPLGTYGENKAIFATAIADINNSGKKSIVFSEFIIGSNTLAKLHAYSFGKDSNNKFTLTQLWETTIGVTNDSSGSQYHPAIANIDQDAWPEIIIDSFTQVYAFDGKTGALQWNRSRGMNFGSPVVADLDHDGRNEIIVNTYDYACPSGHTCTNATNVIKLNSDGTPFSVTPITAGAGWSPYQTPAIANLDDDDNLEIVSYFNNGTKGKIVVTDGNTFANEGTYTDSNNLDFLGGSPVIVDADPSNPGKEILAVTAHGKKLFNESYYGDSGKLLVLGYSGSSDTITELWNVPISAGLYGSPAVGDYDNDNAAEVIVTHAPFQSGSSGMAFDQSNHAVPMDGVFFLAPPASNVTFEYNNLSLQTAGVDAGFDVVGGINKQPLLTVPEEVFARAGEAIQINYTIYDANNDSTQAYFSAPFSQTGFWNTTINDSGNYYVYATASDGNLSQTKETLVRVFRQDAIKREDNATLNFSSANSFTRTIELGNKTRALVGRIYLDGQSVLSNSTTYQSNATLVQVNSFNSTENQLIDQNWSSYYSAGSLTGAIVEERNLTLVSQPRHIIYKLRIKVGGEGHGRFGVYDYTHNWYDLVTSTIAITNESYEDYYFEVYDDNQPFLTSSDNTFLLKVANVSIYLNGTSTRWYYRYIDGDYYDQRLYESAVELASAITTPNSLAVALNGQNQTIINGSLHGKTVEQVMSLNQTVVLQNSSTNYSLLIPRNAKISSVLVKVGTRKVSDINATSFEVSESLEPTSINEISSYASLPSAVMSLGNGTIINITAPKNISSFNLQAFCSDWTVEPTGGASLYIKHVYYGPYCANEYVWHTADVDNDGYTEWYMLKGETYNAWLQCTAETAAYSDTKVNSLIFDSNSATYNAVTASREYSQAMSSTATSISYPQAECDTSGSGGSGWYQFYGGNLFRYWDSNSNGQYDAGEHTENYLVLECAVNADCADDKYCNTNGDNNPQNNICDVPSCSGVSCSSWENTAYSSHACGCTLSANRCDTSKYGWTNIASNQYCNVNHDPSSDSRCNAWEDSSISNHTETCTVKSGQCSTAYAQLNSSLYCNGDHYISPIPVTINVRDKFSNSFISYDDAELQIGSDVQKQLDTCTTDMCNVSISLSSEYNVTFNVSEIALTYTQRYVDITNAIQNFTQTCTNCNMSVTIYGQDALVNYSSLVYYANNSAPYLNKTNYTIDLTTASTLSIDFSDADNDQLSITVNDSVFVQAGNSLVWSPRYLDAGNYSFNITASDGIVNASYIVNVSVVVPPVATRTFQPINTNSSVILYEAVFGNYLDPNAQTMNWNFTVDGVVVANSTQPIVLQRKTEASAYIEYNFTTDSGNDIKFVLYNQNYTVQAQSYQFYSNPLRINSFAELYKNQTNVIYEVEIENLRDASSVSNISWILNTSESIISGTQQLNITARGKAKLYISNTFSGFGSYLVTLTATQGTTNYSKNLTTVVQYPVSVLNITELNANETNKTIEVLFYNDPQWSTNVSNFNITLQVANQTATANLLNMSSGSYMRYYLQLVNLTIGANLLNITTKAPSYTSSNLYNLTVVNPFNIDSFTILNQNATNVTLEFAISKSSTWNPFALNWTMNMDDSMVTNTQALTLNNSLKGYVGYTYNTTGIRQIILTTFSNKFSTNATVTFG